MFTANKTTLEFVKGMGNFNPAYAKHVSVRNGLVEMLGMSMFENIDMLDLPMCPKCERPAMHHDNGGFCTHCGIFSNVTTFREYINMCVQELGLKTDELAALENIMGRFNEYMSEEEIKGVTVTVESEDNDGNSIIIANN